MSFYIVHSLNHYVSFHLKDSFLFHFFFNINSRLDMFVRKILIYFFLSFSYNHLGKVNYNNLTKFSSQHILYESTAVESTHYLFIHFICRRLQF